MEIEGAEKWIEDALNFMRASSPTSLKIWLRSVSIYAKTYIFILTNHVKQ